MKNGKRPTKKQCEFISSHGLNYENWYVTKDTSKYLEILNKKSLKLRRLEK